MDVDRWWKLRSRIRVKVTAWMTVRLMRSETSIKPDNDLPKLLMIEWE